MFSSDEVNYLIHRYLIESGFAHSSFAFQQESAIRKVDLKGLHVKPGHLINLLHKGLQYLDVETHFNLDPARKKCIANFSLLHTHECKIVDTTNLDVADFNEKPFIVVHDERAAKRQRKDSTNNQQSSVSNNIYNQSISSNGNNKVKEKKRLEKKEKSRKDSINNMNDSTDTTTTAPPANMSTPNTKYVDIESSDNIKTLSGHSSEVFVCSWNPVFPLLASGSGDGTARIWSISDRPGTDTKDPIILDHAPLSNSLEKGKDITTINWHPSGEFLATGSYDGKARMWSRNGELKFIMKKHDAPIFSLRWNKQADLLLTGSADKSVIIWDTKTGEARQQFNFHGAPVLDVDWRDNSTFASSSSDTHIYVCQLGSPEPLQLFAGHTNEVNSLKWDPSGSYLASGSDDMTAKIWSMESKGLLHELLGHEKEVYSLKWCPVTTSLVDGKSQRLLATASFDSSVKIWDSIQGTCIYTLKEHTDNVYSVTWSPNGLFLASGSLDKSMSLWSVKDGTLVRNYKSSQYGGIYEVNWNPKGDQMAICYEQNTVIILYNP